MSSRPGFRAADCGPDLIYSSRHHAKDKQRLLVSVVAHVSLPGHQDYDFVRQTAILYDGIARDPTGGFATLRFAVVLFPYRATNCTSVRGSRPCFCLLQFDR
jgi:hypothetical protein